MEKQEHIIWELCSLTLHYQESVSADQVKEYIRTKRADHSNVSLWADYKSNFFEVEEVRPGVWQASPTC